jgi:crotonobetainyl-CoA:carnitine CoA-transferase CaiB-like acyl-CoA transferase
MTLSPFPEMKPADSPCQESLEPVPFYRMGHEQASEKVQAGTIPAKALTAAPSGPLVGIKILDFCSFIAGSYGAMLLGDLGAEIIKVEPLAGDQGRSWGPFLAGESRFFQGWNRNKRSLAIDLLTEAGREAIFELVRRTDVVIENFRPGITEKLQIDYPRLRIVNPKVIYCSSTAFGSKGPLSHRPAYDPVLQAMGGAAYGSLRFAGKVALCSVAVSDYQAAMLAATGITAALFHRERTGQGQLVETSLLQGIMSVQSHFYCRALEREEEGPLGICPYRLFETKEGLIFIGAATDKFWRLLCDALGLPELGTDPKFATNPQRLLHQAELIPRLEPFFLEKTAAEWETLLVEKGFPCSAVGTYEQFFAHPQVKAMDMNPIVEHPTIGPMRLAGVPIHFEKTPGCIQRAPPLLGEHTDEILREIGYGDQRLEELKQQGIILRSVAAERFA